MVAAHGPEGPDPSTERSDLATPVNDQVVSASRQLRTTARADFVWPDDDGQLEAAGPVLETARLTRLRSQSALNTLVLGATARSRFTDRRPLRPVRTPRTQPRPSWDGRTTDGREMVLSSFTVGT